MNAQTHPNPLPGILFSMTMSKSSDSVMVSLLEVEHVEKF